MQQQTVNLETNNKMSRQEIIILIPGPTEGESSTPLSSCLLCNSQDGCYPLTDEIRDAWSTNVCCLYSIDSIQAKKVIETACYCFDCHQELRSISQIYEEIERLHSNLESIKIKYTFQLNDLVQSLTESSSDPQSSNNCKEKDQKYQLAPVPEVVKSDVTSCNFSNSDDISKSAEEFITGDSVDSDSVTTIAEVGTYSSINSEVNKVEVQQLKGLPHSDQPALKNDEEAVDPSVLLVWDDYAICYSEETDTVELTEQDQSLPNSDPFNNLKEKYKLEECFVKVEEMDLKDVRRYLSKATGRDVDILPSYPCPFLGCKKRFPSKILTDAHFKSKHEGIRRPFTCFKCGKTFRRYYMLLQHNNIHEGLNPFDCTDCGIKLPTSELLYNHIRKFHKEKHPRILCEQCGKSYQRDQGTLHTCRLTPNGVKRHTCEICEKKFARRQNLQAHRATHPELQLQQFKCEFCNKVLTSRKNFLAHTNKHTGQFKYQCELCDYKCSLPQSMKKHSLVHSDAKDFECEICHHRFKCLSQLRSHHSFKHSDGKNVLYCHICGVQSCNKYTLSRHLQAKHSDNAKPFKCTLCSESFALQTYLNKHMKRSHEDGKPLRGITKKAKSKKQTKIEDVLQFD